MVINGSRLGKAFSANQFQEKFSNLENKNRLGIPEQNIEKENNISSGIESAIGGLFDLLPTDVQEDYPQQHLKNPKKKKRRYGRQV